MKTILVLLAVFAGISAAQPSSQRIVYVTTAPAGACSPNGQAFRYVISGGDAGKLYACDTTWTLLASAAGGGGVPGGSTTQIQYNNSGVFGGASGTAWTDGTRTLIITDSGGSQAFNFSAQGDANGCGVFYVNCDGIPAPASVPTTPGTSGGGIGLDSVNGGQTTITTTGVGGAGGIIGLSSGRGANISTATTNGTGGAGGDIIAAAGAGGNCTGAATCTGGRAGNVYVTLNAGGTGSTANGAPGSFLINGDIGIVASIARNGLVTGTLYGSVTNCADSAGAAACGAAPAGSFVIDAGSTATVVSTTAVTANSQIFLQEDSSLSTRLSVTCNTQSSLTLGALRVTARTAGTSFTATLEVGPTTNPMCVNYWIVN